VKRRTFIAGLGSAAAWPMVARAQQPAMPVIGFLHSTTLAAISPRAHCCLFGWAWLNWATSRGRNVLIEYRWAEGRDDRLPRPGRRLGAPSGRRYHGVELDCLGTRCEGGDQHSSDCLLRWRRPGENRPRRKPEPAGRKTSRVLRFSPAS